MYNLHVDIIMLQPFRLKRNFCGIFLALKLQYTYIAKRRHNLCSGMACYGTSILVGVVMYCTYTCNQFN